MNKSTVKLLLLPATIIVIGFALGLWLQRLNTGSPTNSDDAIGHSTAIFVGLGPALSVVAALQLSRFRVFCRHRQNIRDVLKISVRSTGPSAILSAFLSLGTLSINGALGSARLPYAVLIHFLLISVFTLLGIALALYLPRAIALTFAAFLPFVLATYPPAISSPEWRHLFGQSDTSCCTIDTSLHPLMLQSSLLSLGTITIALFALIIVFVQANRARVLGFASAFVLTMVGTGLAFHLASPLGYEAATPRDRSELQCSEGACTWPETPHDVTAINVEAAKSLRLTDVPLKDFSTWGDSYLSFAYTDSLHQARQSLLYQLAWQDPQLRSAKSCISDESGRAFSIADLVDGLPAATIERALTQPDGTLRPVESFDRQALSQEANSVCESAPEATSQAPVFIERNS